MRRHLGRRPVVVLGGARDGFGGSGFAVVGVAAPQNAETTGSDDLGGSGGGFRRGSGASPRTRPRGVAGGRSLAECGRADAPKAETAGSDAAGGVAPRGGGGARRAPGGAGGTGARRGRRGADPAPRATARWWADRAGRASAGRRRPGRTCRPRRSGARGATAPPTAARG